MRKVALIQEELYAYLGFMYCVSSSKDLDYEFEVFLSDVNPNYIEEVMEFDPDIVILSVTTPNYHFTKDTCKKLKELKPNIFTLLGGWHATFYTELLENEDCFDGII